MLLPVPSRAPRLSLSLPLLLLLLLPAGLPAQDSAFTKEEFAARRARLVELIPDGAALVFGGEDHGENVRFRQAPDFFYLTGIEQPGSVLLVSGVTKRAIVFAPRQPGAGADAGPLDSTAQARRGIEVLPMESFFATLKKELVHDEDYATREEARASLFEYIEVFYNRVRRHSSLGYRSPAEYERA